ncbi:hypothetical protein [Sinorhizobium fredii]|uniref:hypothetical protein n=1 Tax=Rhizobium fredii TaxID=380 RepID=UPI0012FD66DE|nr:hypothetical protein [Sinorhizobium fredii]
MRRTVGKIILDDDQALVVFDDGVAPLYADLVTAKDRFRRRNDLCEISDFPLKIPAQEADFCRPACRRHRDTGKAFARSFSPARAPLPLSHLRRIL